MKKTLLTLTLAAVVAAGTILSGSFVSAADHSVVEGDSIQAVVNAADAGDTINIAAGNYTGTVTVDKPLTILGAQAGVDARDRSGAPESVITSAYGGGFNVQSPDVVIDGFTIEGSTLVSPNYGRAIVLSASADVSNLAVTNNIITGNQTGIVTASGHNVNVTGLTVSNNQFADNYTDATPVSTGIFVVLSEGSGISVVNNSFSGSGNSTGNSNAVSLSGNPGAPMTDITISGNTSVNDGSFAWLEDVTDVVINNNQSSDQGGNGVLVGNGVTSLAITGNTFTDSNNGVRFNSTARPASDVVISGNTITGMAMAGVMVNENSVIEDVVVIDNTITGNASGITNDTSTAVDANNNWWGCEAGPGANGCDTTDGVVLASSWFTDDGMTVTNLDADDSAPGVPNTGLAGSLSPSLLISLAVAGAAVVGSFLLYRRRSANKL